MDCVRRGDICAALGCSPRKRSSLPPAAPDGRHPSRYDAAGVLGRMTYSFGKVMLDAGQRGTLQADQLDELSVHDQSRPQIAGFEACWAREHERHPGSPRLWRASVAHVYSSFWAAAWYNALESATRVLQPVLLREFLVWIQDGDAQDTAGRGIALALGLGVLSFLQAHVHHKLFYFGMRMGFNLRVAATGAVYNKVLRLSGGSLRAATAGHAVNLVSNDVARFDSFCPFVHFTWSPLLDLVAVAVLMTSQVGWEAALAGVASCAALVPLQMCFAKRFSVLRERTASFTDRRVKLTGELVNGIGTVKTFGWEQPYMERVGRIRTSERHNILRSQIMKAFNLAIYFANVAIASLATFTTYWALGNELTMPVAFSTLSYLYVLRFSLGRSFALALEFFPEMWVSLRRLETFLSLPEVRRAKVCASCSDSKAIVVHEDLEHALTDASKGDATEKVGDSSSSVVVADGASLAWDSVSDQNGSVAAFSLSELRFNVTRGQLIVVLGPVGCGKSALLCALAGELDSKSGTLHNRAESLAFVAQQPWVREGSIRANIVFGRSREFDPSKPAATAEEMHDAEAYEEAIEAAALKADIKQWEDGERTLVGEKGVTLSGGQKARVALARAVYARANLALLDDPLSAVDPAVARHIFERGIRDVLLQRHGATVFLATHQQQYASSECVDKVLLLDEHGRQVACAPYSELQQQGLLQPHVDVADDASDDDNDEDARLEDSVLVEESNDKKPRQVIANEDRVVGQVTRSTYYEYFRAGGSYCSLAVLVQFVGAQVTLMAADYWLLRWTTHGGDRDWYWPGIFIALCSGCVVLGFSRAFSFFVFSSWAGANLHTRMLSGVFHAPMSFFHANPSGRILNKFSADQGQIDELLPTVLFDFLQSAAIVIGAIVLVIAAIPWLLFLLIPIAWLFVGVRRRFLASARELKRLDAISRSPMFSEFSATLGGLQTVRAYGGEALCRQRFSELLDANGRCWYAHLIASRWLGFNLDMMCVALLVVLCLGGALLRVYAPDAVDGGLVGFAIVHTLALSGVFQWAVRQSAMLESQMTSIERALFYARLQSEENAAMDTRGGVAALAPPKNWPAHGRVQMHGVEVRYGHGMPHVLKGIDADWRAGARVGVLGRTGSGKSTLVHALLRLNEVVGGKIEIDGVDITGMSLCDLRREGALCLIPQEPCLFSGTLRSNLDPFCTKNDDELWAALRSVQLEQALRSNDAGAGLDAEVCEGGANFSVGERQLLSLARAILRGSRVFITDEATANVDFDTDTLVQRMLRESDIFRDRTVVQIAHRMHTIIDSDLLILLDNGCVVETGAPAELLARPDSLFSSMVKDTGNATELRARAKAAAGTKQV